MSPLPLTDLDTVAHVLHRRAALTPRREAVTFWEDDEQVTDSLTYGELHEAAAAMAWGLRRRLEPGDRVLLVYPPGLAFVRAFFACLYAGIVAAPLPAPSPRRGVEQIARLLVQLSARAVLVSGQVVRQFRRSALPPELRDALVVTDDGAFDPGASTPALAPPRAEDLAYLQCTSGSTSRPRAVMITHRNMMANTIAIAERFRHTEQSQGLIWLPHCHDMGLIGGIVQPVAVGFPVALQSPLAVIQHPRRWLRAVSQVRATTSGGPMFAYEACITRIADSELANFDLGSWTAAFVGAEPLHAATLARFAEKFAPCGFRPASLLPCYGLAEATLMVTGGPGGLRVLDRPHPDHRAPLVACGVPIAGHDVAVVDPATRRRTAEGAVGELWVRGPTVAAGYWQDETETQRTFGGRLSDDGAGPYLRTGDLGLSKDGDVYVTGRIKDLIIIRGRNLHPQDLEATARGAADGVRLPAAAAFSVLLDGHEELVVVQEVDPGTPPAAGREIADAILSEHGVRCHDVVLVRRHTIPRTTSGKVMRWRCRERYLAGELGAVAARAGSAATPQRSGAA